jgi:hypothetical protein
MNLVQVHILRLQALQALVQLEEDLLAREPLAVRISRIMAVTDWTVRSVVKHPLNGRVPFDPRFELELYSSLY